LNKPLKIRVKNNAVTAANNMIPKKDILKVAQHIDDATTNMINPISSGSFIGVRNLTIDNAPSKPRDKGSENWIQIKIAVTDIPSKGNARCTSLPVDLLL
jgi:hypothetical protein